MSKATGKFPTSAIAVTAAYRICLRFGSAHPALFSIRPGNEKASPLRVSLRFKALGFTVQSALFEQSNRARMLWKPRLSLMNASQPPNRMRYIDRPGMQTTDVLAIALSAQVR